ncbi:acetate--CoA ligase alpha subunit [Blastopirellula marina]|uniref:GNAT family N-acetyltransferase n=1 Tax=Blastopirellula marina TaxID=124 RepID=A0A2S8G8E2_9BACT|nr:bifunctional acetate--CoA ligase family protein/GNAT family N-acetyltransferase [Blastopirellula marina]PQO40725.1 GNAT family N-acetyltransferase [Blastopirellula marina]PTL45685.1 GNAT family N-acetyltransferase [Blastopirellula marina]
MSVYNLNAIFRPESVAVIGASSKDASVGNTVLKNLTKGGFGGHIFAINPKYDELEGHPCFPKIGDVPEKVDLAVICTPAATVPNLVQQCGEAGVRGIIILSAGFREVGADGKKLEEEIAKTAAKFRGLRIVGPNCLGVMATHSALNASFAAAAPDKGKVAFISQSGALCTAVLDWAFQEQIGFSYFVSVGNMLDVDLGDLIDYFANDPWTESIFLYVESVKEARKFMSACRSFARNKPIIVYKAGRFAKSAQAAASHTGAMAGVDTVYQAAFDRAGIVRVNEISDIFDCTALLARRKLPKGGRLAIVTNAGGPGVMATDALLARNGELAEISDETREKLNQFLPAAWSHSNPIDILGDADPERLAKTLEIVQADSEVDAILVVFSPQAMSQPTAAAQAVVDVSKKTTKPILTSWMGGKATHEGVTLFNAANIPTYRAPEEAVKAFMYLVSYVRTHDVLYETPRDIPVGFPLERSRMHTVFESLLGEGNDTLSEIQSKALLDAYEIPVAKPFLARDADEAVQLAKRTGFPVAMKLISPQITHKTDVGGVELGVASDEKVRAAFDRIVQSAKSHCPDAHIEGVSVQRMITHASGVELIIGARRDPVFGPVLLVGAGGTSAELFQDTALELPPVNERLARRMLESLRIWPLLKGYRGGPGVDVDKLIEVLIRMSYLVADFPEIQELDINPLLATPHGAVALDARIMLDRSVRLNPPRRFSHLAIRPYPEELVRPARMSDGTACTLRPIKPEDEPLWHDFHANCSQKTLWFRFRSLVKEITHDMATRFCFIDYDRELTIVAEIEQDFQRKIVGVANIMADADRIDAEFAVIVGDDYQGLGLGSVLTDYCLEICCDWGIKTVLAETSPDNQRMLAIFQERGFKLDNKTSPDAVLCRKDLC